MPSDGRRGWLAPVEPARAFPLPRSPLSTTNPHSKRSHLDPSIASPATVSQGDLERRMRPPLLDGEIQPTTRSCARLRVASRKKNSRKTGEGALKMTAGGTQIPPSARHRFLTTLPCWPYGSTGEAWRGVWGKVGGILRGGLREKGPQRPPRPVRAPPSARVGPRSRESLHSAGSGAADDLPGGLPTSGPAS